MNYLVSILLIALQITIIIIHSERILKLRKRSFPQINIVLLPYPNWLFTDPLLLHRIRQTILIGRQLDRAEFFMFHNQTLFTFLLILLFFK